MNSRILCIFIFILAILGCKREDKNPELRDPIYSDLQSEKRTLEQMKEDSQKKIESITKELAKTQPRTLDRKNAVNDIAKENIKLNKLTELIEYYEIRIQQRFNEARRSYREAFLIDKENEWPSKAEFEAYKVNKRLVRTSKNWNDRVPRSNLQQVQLGSPGASEEKKEEPKKEE